MTTAKSLERALDHVTEALARELAVPEHPGVHAHLTAAYVQLTAVARLLETPA